MSGKVDATEQEVAAKRQRVRRFPRAIADLRSPAQFALAEGQFSRERSGKSRSVRCRDQTRHGRSGSGALAALGDGGRRSAVRGQGPESRHVVTPWITSARTHGIQGDPLCPSPRGGRSGQSLVAAELEARWNAAPQRVARGEPIRPSVARDSLLTPRRRSRRRGGTYRRRHAHQATDRPRSSRRSSSWTSMMRHAAGSWLSWSSLGAPGSTPSYACASLRAGGHTKRTSPHHAGRREPASAA
jgi:hypothetical protein